MKIIKNRGFTIIELLVVITIITTMILGIRTISISSVQKKYDFDLYKLKIQNIVESARNGALIGKYIEMSGIKVVPNSWDIGILNGTNGIQSKFEDNSGIWYNYSQYSYNNPRNEEIVTITCKNRSSSDVVVDEAHIFFDSSDITITGSNSGTPNTGCDTAYGLELQVRLATFTDTMTFNVLTGNFEDN